MFPGAVESTNSFLRDNRDRYEPFTVVVTDHQTKGRGRLGREWLTPQGQGLALSVLLPLPPEASTWVPLLAGAALVRALRLEGLSQAELKWPNDVLVSGKKLAGVLCEGIGKGQVIVGAGINLSFEHAQPPTPHATSVFGTEALKWEVVDRILSNWLGHLQRWSQMESDLKITGAEEIVAEVLGTLARRVEVWEVDGTRWTGVAEGLNQQGHLLVMPERSETLRVVASADIEHLYQ